MNKILIIDDERPTLGMFRLFLGAYGYEVLTAENGTEGIGIFKRETPRIVITDIKMPGIDGLEVLRQIKLLEPATEVIVITGHGDLALALDALNLDATDFISKPIQKSALDCALKRAEEAIIAESGAGPRISVREADGIGILEVGGKVTSESEPQLAEAFSKAFESGTRKILVSFDEKCTINGTGIGVLNRLLPNIKTKGRHLAISGLSENLTKIFELVGIPRSAKIFKLEGDAVKYLSGME